MGVSRKAKVDVCIQVITFAQKPSRMDLRNTSFLYVVFHVSPLLFLSHSISFSLPPSPFCDVLLGHHSISFHCISLYTYWTIQFSQDLFCFSGSLSKFSSTHHAHCCLWHLSTCSSNLRSHSWLFLILVLLLDSTALGRGWKELSPRFGHAWLVD